MKKIFNLFLGIATMFVFTNTAYAATKSIGNDASLRSITDTYSNFTIVDTNRPSTFNGVIHTFRYYASIKNPFRFIVVDNASVVKWVSNQITPSVIGSNTFEPSKPVKVKPGWNVGMYFVSTGTIPFDYAGKPSWYTSAEYGVPEVGKTLSYEGSSNRIYSFVAISKPESEGEKHEEAALCEDEKRFIETVVVPAGKETDTFSVNTLAIGTKYILKARGTANAGDSIEFDARYSFRTGTSSVWTDAVSTYEGYGNTLLDLFYNGTTPWKSYNSSHKYEVSVPGTGSFATFRIYDIYYPNNSGNLYVDIYSKCSEKDDGGEERNENKDKEDDHEQENDSEHQGNSED
jgi:hypothetical protein